MNYADYSDYPWLLAYLTHVAAGVLGFLAGALYVCGGPCA